MLRWFRRQAALVAGVVFSATVTMGGAAIAPHGDDCHDQCGQVAVAHDPAAHRIGGAPDDAPGAHDHCVVCHWVRAFRPRAEARAASSPDVAHRLSFRFDPFVAPAAAPYAQPPLRSPPSAFFLS